MFTPLNRPKRNPLKCDNRMVEVYKPKNNTKTGKRELVVVEKIDFVDKIEEYAKDVELKTITQKYNVNLSKNIEKDKIQMIDLTQMPENLMEIYNTLENAKNIWEHQPTDVKNKFNNDFKNFVAGSENGKIIEMLNEKTKKRSTIKTTNFPNL